jgi:hypothetical protein
LKRIVPLFPSHHLNSTNGNSTQGGCQYEVLLYATPRNFSISNSGASKPNLLPVVIFVAFIGLAIGFILYDRFLESRIQSVAKQAARSNAIVSSLFPTQVHDRLFDKDEASESQSRRSRQSGKRQLNKRVSKELELNNQVDVHSPEMYLTKPIADLFPSTTLLFSDLAGFTAWSVSEPLDTVADHR